MLAKRNPIIDEQKRPKSDTGINLTIYKPLSLALASGHRCFKPFPADVSLN